MTPSHLPYAPDLVVLDVSFISLTKVLPAVLACAAPRYDALAMVKPQFEVGRAGVSRGGVVREPEARRGALADVAECAQRARSRGPRLRAVRAARAEGQPARRSSGSPRAAARARSTDVGAALAEVAA